MDNTLLFFDEKEKVPAYFFMFKEWSKLYQKGKAFVIFSRNKNEINQKDIEFSNLVKKNSINYNTTFTCDLVLTGPVLFIKHISQKKPLLNIFIPNYLVQKAENKTIVLIPIPDIFQTIIRIKFNEEKTQRMWFDTFIKTKRIQEKATVPVLFPLLNNNSLSQQTASLEDDGISIVHTINGKRIENNIKFNSLFIIGSPFEFYYDVICDDNNSSNPILEEIELEKDDLFISLMISTSKSTNYICTFDQIETLLAAYCNIFLACQKKTIPQQQSEIQSEIYHRQKRYDGILDGFPLTLVSAIKDPTQEITLKTKKENMKFTGSSLLPKNASKEIRIIDFNKPVHRTIVFTETRDLFPHSLLTQNDQNQIKEITNVFQEETQKIINTLDKNCAKETNIIANSFQTELNELFLDDVDDLFSFKETSQKAFFNKDAIDLNDKLHVIQNNPIFDNLVETIDVVLNNDPKDCFYNSEILDKLNTYLRSVKYTINMESDTFLEFVILTANIISDTCDYNTFPYSLLWLLDSHPSLKKCFPFQKYKNFEELMVTFVVRLLLSKQLSFLIDTISSDTEWTKKVYKMSSLMASPQFIPEFLGTIHSFESLNFTGAFRLHSKIKFTDFGSQRIDLLIEDTCSQISLHFHKGNDNNSVLSLLARLSSLFAKFLNIGYFKTANGPNAWSLFLRTNEFGFRTNELTILDETVKRAERNKNSPQNWKIAFTIFTGIQLNLSNIWLLYLSKGAKKLSTHKENAPIFSYSQLLRVTESFTSLAAFKLELPDNIFSLYPSLF